MRESSGSPFPLKEQELLLQAALFKKDKMLVAWEKWKSLVDFEEDIEHASFRLLPLLYHNLYKQGNTDPLMLRLKGIYRQSWSKNHLLFHKTGQILSLLHKNSIPTIVLKGIALSILTYKNYSVRPMADMDILIPISYTLKTIELLKTYGWEIQEEQYLEHNLKYGRSATFTDNNKTELDLHWYPIFEAHDNITDDDFWNEAVPLVAAGVSTKAFCLTDNLFHTIVHGMRFNIEPPIRWVADAVTLINSKNSDVDWKRLMHHTKKFRVTLQMKAAFNYLIENFDVVFPEFVMDELNNIQITFSDRLVYKHAKKYGDREPKTVYEKLYSVYAGYLRQTSKIGFWSQSLGFIKYIRFRTKGKPYLRILIYYFSLLFKSSGK